MSVLIKFLNQKKSHTCEEGGAHLKIYFWHLLMNLKKQLLKKLLKWANKKQNNFTIYNVALFLKKNKEKHLAISLF